MDMTEKTLSAERKYHGRILDLYVDAVELPGGRPGQREYVKHPGGVCVAPLTEDGALLFVRQFRYPYGRVLLELPAGKLTPGASSRRRPARPRRNISRSARCILRPATPTRSSTFMPRGA